MTITGSCRCEQITFEIKSPPAMTTACHCVGCQKMSSSAFSLTALFPAESFAITQGEPVIGGLRGPTRHYFCPSCLTWLFTRPEGVETFVGVRSSLLENPQLYPPFMETWTAEKLPWVTTAAAFSYEAFPDPSEFPQLMERFQAVDKRN
ncbi:GFA family protein [Pseudomonas sp. PH1b]|uniref:GFA family protein n=1 Tax=Pseudomonas sp. PH1b TaxID=1397282 RepID=UPI0004A7A4A6|nr:GFA family protein [Pseudomonas sp. PH1b]